MEKTGKIARSDGILRMAARILFALLSTVSLFAAPALQNGVCRELLFGTEDITLLLLLGQYSGLFWGDGILPALVFFGLFAVYGKLLRQERARPFSVLSLVWAVLVSFTMLVGLSCRLADNLRIFFRNKGALLLAVTMFMGYVPLFYAGIRLLGAWLERAYPAAQRGADLSRPTGASRKKDVLAFLAMFVSWLPYMLVFFPGSVAGDTSDQIDFFMGNLPWTNHHPVASSVLIGSAVKLGGLLGSDNLGIFLYAVLQALALAFALCCTIACMRAWESPKWLRVGTLLFFCLFPLWGMYAQYVGKDTLFVALVVLYTAYLCKLVHAPETILRTRSAVIFGGLGILTLLLRNNGVYVVLITLTVCLLAFRGKAAKLRFALLLGSTLLFQLVWAGVLLPAWNVEKGSVREALSIPLQQTARYVCEYENEVTEEERTAISRVLDFSRLKDYDSDLSDPVKSYFYDGTSFQDKAEYFRVWLQMLRKHPLTYIEATVSNSYSYYCIYDSPIAVYRTYLTNYTGGHVSAAFPEPVWMLARSLADATACLPVMSLLYRQSLYTWTLLALVVLLLNKRKPWYLVCLVPALVSFLVCVASPADGDMRYFLPVVATLPLLCASSLSGVYGKQAEDGEIASL